MIEFIPYVWALVTIAAIIVESATADLVTIWFIPAGIISAIVSLLPVKIEVWVQVLIFFVTALVLVIMSKTLFKEFFKKKPIVPTNLDSVIGKDAVVTETINNIQGKGAVKVLGKEWSAITLFDDETIEKGSIVTVLEIRGVKLICTKKQ
jgi:membrane protein implicated in regulation of membrane protease activity